LDRYKEFNPSLPGKNTLLMKGMTQPEDEQKINTAPCFGGREMFKNGRTGFPVPILIKPGNRIGKGTVDCQDIPKECLEIKIHGIEI
jgi:hypothetical protein